MLSKRENENINLPIINLGRKLYFDNRLSVNDNQSCNTCHNVLNKKAGVDNLHLSPGVFGKLGQRNTPTVLNSGFQIAQFWDGKAKTLEEQIRVPLFNPLQMAMPDERYLVDKISSIPEYKELFEKAFSDTFLAVGCANCHKGPLLGGNSFQKMGIKKHYENKEDTGRFKITSNEEDMYVFKVPSLRNVALTGPYFHDGSQTTLDLAVKKMAEMQLGKNLSEKEVESIVTFLNALTDKPREY